MKIQIFSKPPCLLSYMTSQMEILLKLGGDEDNDDGQVAEHGRHHHQPHSHTQRQVPHDVLAGVEGVRLRHTKDVVVVFGQVAAGDKAGLILRQRLGEGARNKKISVDRWTHIHVYTNRR